MIRPSKLRGPGIDLLREVVDRRLRGMGANEIVADLGVCRNDVLLVVSELNRLNGVQISSRPAGRPINRYSTREGADSAASEDAA